MDTMPSWFPGAHASETPDRIALRAAGGTELRTYRDLDTTARSVASLLAEHGLRPGDHACLWFDNELDYPAYWWGAHYAGLYYTLINARLNPPEAAYIIGDSGARVVIVGRRLFKQHGEVLRSLVPPDCLLIGDTDDADGLRARLRSAQAQPPADDRPEGAAMLYSAGTTGRPKAVKRTMSGMPLGSSPGVGLLTQILFGFGPDTVYLSPAPLYHAAPYAYVSAATALGATAVIMDHFDAEPFLAAVEAHAVTHTQLVPTMFVRLLALPEAVREKYDLSSLTCAIHSAAPCPVPIKQQMLDWWGPIIHEYYSGTEGAGFVYCAPTDWLEHPGTVGRPVIGAAHIVDDAGTELPPGNEGTIYFSGGLPFEYHNAAEQTAQSHLPNGWATFGDIGRLDDDGFLYLTDRRTNLILVGGVNVYPQEAENILAAHPKVHDVAVIGVPHAEYGEEVKAVVRPAPGVPGDAALAAELIAHCRSHLATIKCPRSVDFRDELPREPNGKLLKRILKEEYAP